MSVQARSKDLISGSVFEAASTTQKHSLGTRVHIGDRSFVYVSSKIAAVAGVMVSAPVTNNSIVTVAATYFGADLATAPIATEGGAIGDLKVRIYGITLAANALAEGYLNISVTPGEGHLYAVKSNEVITTATSGLLTLYEPIRVALTNASAGYTVYSPYKECIACPAGGAALPLGVPVVAAAGTDEYFFWIQTWGPASCKSDQTAHPTPGLPAHMSNDHAGELDTALGATMPTVGIGMSTDTVALFDCYYLTLSR